MKKVLIALILVGCGRQGDYDSGRMSELGKDKQKWVAECAKHRYLSACISDARSIPYEVLNENR